MTDRRLRLYHGDRMTHKTSMTMNALQNQPTDEEDNAFTDHLLDQMAGYYILSVVLVEWLQAARAQRAAAEADAGTAPTQTSPSMG